MLSQTMAKAWAPEISVNCVAPGMIVQGEVNEAYEHFAQQDPHAAQRYRARTWRPQFSSSPLGRILLLGNCSRSTAAWACSLRTQSVAIARNQRRHQLFTSRSSI